MKQPPRRAAKPSNAERAVAPAGEERRRAVTWDEPETDLAAPRRHPEDAEEAHGDEEAARAAAEGEDSHAPDDALGLYLRQMGAIPLLSRDQELALAKQLEWRRRRYRHAALSCWRTLAKVVETFERVQKGQLALDPTIDVVNTLDLSRENI